MIDFIEESRETLGVEPICRVLQFAPSTYYDRRAIARDPERASARAKSDAALSVKIDGAWAGNRKLYGARKIWHVLRREGEDVARCTVERLMRALGIKGVIRGRRVITTNPFAIALEPMALQWLAVFALPRRQGEPPVQGGQFKTGRPNKLWVSDFTYVPTWSGTVCVAFVIDVFARRIVGWRTSTSMKTQFVLDALEQAIWQRKTPDNKDLVHHSDRPSHGLKANRCRATGSQYLSIKYTERLAEAEIDLSVGTVGDAYDNALAECVIHSGAYAAPLGPRSPSNLQNRSHQPDRSMEIDVRSRMGNAEMGRLV